MGLYFVLGFLVCFIAVIIVRTLLFRPVKREDVHPDKIALNEEKIVEDMVEMIKCKTVSDRDEALVDRGEFKKFEELMRERFPRINEACSFEKIGKTGLLYHLKGQRSDEPSVCMAHYDVVPVHEEGWTKPAFQGIIEDGCIWGRGTIDTKGTLCGVMEALEYLLGEGYVPKQDLYLAFSGEEEIDGGTCPAIVSYFEEKGIKPAFVLDEGGAVVSNVFPGVTRESAMIGIGEKGSLNLDLTIESNGGHASTPPPHSVLGQLSKAATRIEGKPFKKQFTKPVKEMYDTLGRESSFLFRMIFANLWCFMPLLNILCKKIGGEMNALMRTTVAVTKMEGSKAYNVLPPKATMGINVRIIGEDTVQSACDYLQKVIKNDKISISVVNGMNPSRYSDTHCDAWYKLKGVVEESWPGVIVTPYLMMACSDSRHYCRITDRVYRFSAMRLSKEERAMVHGNDERIPIETLLKTVEFYVRLLCVL